MRAPFKLGATTRWTALQLGKGALQAVGALVIYAIAAIVIVRMLASRAPIAKSASRPSPRDDTHRADQSMTPNSENLSQTMMDAIRWRSPLLVNAVESKV